MNRRNHPALTSGAIPSIIGNGLHNEIQVLKFPLILQVLGYEILQLENFTIIRVKKCVVHEVATRAAKKILFFYVEPIVPGSEVGEKIGNPQILNRFGEVTEEAAAKPAPVGNICKNYWLSLQSNTMRARCYVCQEPFGESDVVMAPKCGHTFHKTCITQWLSTKNTFCPTCRQTTSNEKLGRIFFDMDFSVEVNSADLQQKLDAFAFELQQSLEFQVVQQELREVRQENVTLKEKSNKYEKDRLDRELVIRQLGTELSILQQRVAFLNKQEEELQSELNTKVQLKQKANEELRKCRRLLSTFRLELQQTKKELKEKEEEEEKSSLAEELIEIYTAENAKLKEKLKALTESISSPSGYPSRLINESPAPTNLRMSNLLMTTPSSPSTPLVPLRMKNSNVPSSRLMLSSQNISSMQLSKPEKEEVTSSTQRKEARKASSSSASVDGESLKFKKMKVDQVDRKFLRNMKKSRARNLSTALSMSVAKYR
ncbi:E3 ubiquitin-protein ligase TRAIP-like isoform X2 [Daphnia pulex]|uniref:E3 ubiquitin-protein ligase TRAIP-like isoform X2 n=1 Tax=Daphnia pulex TaxID=6669 RepID=UPI001EDE9E3D|nr:E3 ubiquitin-protein ligase TRAIP-like isoform X2 [Daphnia pulex]